MKLSKGQGISLFSVIIIFGIFNTVVFLAPLAHTVVFWLGNFFALFALITIGLTLVLYFRNSVKEEKFLSLPAVKTAWTYFVLQTALSLWEMIAFPYPYLVALIGNLVLGAIFSIIILSLYATSSRIDNAEQFTAEKVIFVKQLKLRLDSIETENIELSKRIKELSEDVHYSDAMSHSKLKDIEDNLADVVDDLAENISDTEKAFDLCNQAAKLLKTHNEQCKMYKGVKDVVAENAKRSSNGNGVAIAGVGVTLALFLVTLTVCFVIIPQNKYAAATKLLEAEKYDEATAAFEELGNFRDSEDKAEEIKTILNDKVYAEAEQLFVDGKYAEAIKIYKSLNGYKESKARIEEINNRLSNGNIIYFGTYNNEPIAWQIVKNEENKLLLLADETIKQLPVNSELKDIDFKDSTLNAWLNNDLIQDFTQDQKEKIITTDNVKIFLLNEKTIIELKEAKVDLSCDSEWWIVEKSETGFKYVSKSGSVVNEGDLVVRDKGIRPAVWISID